MCVVSVHVLFRAAGILSQIEPSLAEVLGGRSLVLPFSGISHFRKEVVVLGLAPGQHRHTLDSLAGQWEVSNSRTPIYRFYSLLVCQTYSQCLNYLFLLSCKFIIHKMLNLNLVEPRVFSLTIIVFHWRLLLKGLFLHILKVAAHWGGAFTWTGQD